MERSDELAQFATFDAEMRGPVVESSSKEVNEWIRIGISMGIAASFHPFDYAKTLMQLGYEPIEPIQGKTLLGKPVMILPNIFQYVAYIRRVDGIMGCYVALAPKLMSVLVANLTCRQMALKLNLVQNAVYQQVDNKMSDRDAFLKFQKSLQGDMILCASGVVASQPLHVIYLRTMAQFVGHERMYSNIISAVKEIYKTEGIKGFFCGLAPRLIWDLSCLILTGTAVFLVDRYVLKDKKGRQYSVGILQYLFANILYPLKVSSICMAVSGSRLMAGQPPIMPSYKNWIDCLNDLSQKGELNRGSSSLLRFSPIPSSAESRLIYKIN